MKLAHDIIIRPVITEAAMDMLPAKKYVFEVARTATKSEIAKAVEETFGVTIDDSDVVEMKTVADVVRFIENAKA